MTAVRALALTAAACYAAGATIGVLAAWAAWAATSHEHRYRLTRSTP